MALSIAALLLAAISLLSLPQTGNGRLQEDYKLCTDNLNYSISTSPVNKTVVIVVTPRSESLEVTLYGDECELSCKDDSCSIDPRIYTYNLRSNGGNKEKFIFSNVESKYFCAKVSNITTHASICTYEGTDTEFHPDSIPPLELPESKVNLLMILGIVFCLFLVVISALLLNMKKTSHLIVVPSDESDAPQDVSFPEEIPTALLLYSRDSLAFLNLMAAFRELLSISAGIQVVDPLDGSRFDEIARNPSAWLSRELLNPRTKVIIVVSDVAMQRQRALLSNQRVVTPEPHFLDEIFTQALRHLHDNPYDSSNYSRIFTVRFEGVMTLMENLSLIVPLRCFNLPKHLTNLICEVKGLPSDQFASVEEDLQRSPALHRLQEQLFLATTERQSSNA